MGEHRTGNTRCIFIVGVCMCAVGLGAGIAIGYFAWPRGPKPQQMELEDTIQGYAQSCRKDCHNEALIAASCNVPLPRHYVAHKLASGQTINVDGKLDDAAWKDVPFTENFMDIRGPHFPPSPVETKVKIRWDDTNVYVGAYLQEPHVWATYTQKDSRVYQENAFEAFFDVDNSMSMYKEFEINALGTTWDLMLTRAYMDGGDYFDWEGITKKGVYTDGAVNNASVDATFWSVELAFSFAALSENTTRSARAAVDGEMWFITLARPRYDLLALPNGTYGKKPGTDASWYSWNPTGAVNLHLPSKWGLLFFEEDAPSSTPPVINTKRWITYQALFAVFNALKTRKTVLGDYITDTNLLDVPAFVLSDCIKSVVIALTDAGFTVNIETKKEPGVLGTINQNRYVKFTSS